jgi:glycosyltransferase involved in cell wall biosynthesis
MSISIVIPAYRAEETISRAVRSCLTNCRTNLEIIIVDDGSPDKTGCIADGLAMEDARVHVLHTENHGRSAARNIGAHAATGEWVAFLDADDTLLPGAAKAFENAIRLAKTDLVIFCSQIEGEGRLSQWASKGSDVDENDCALYQAKASALASSMIFGGWSDITPGSRNYEMNSCWARLYRRRRLLELAQSLPGGWEPFPEGLRFSEDRLMNLAYLRSLSGESVGFMPHAVYCWDLSASGTVGKVNADDALSLTSYRSRLSELLSDGFIGEGELGPLYAREATMQFRRAVQAVPAGPSISELIPRWKKVLAGDDGCNDLIEVPSDCLGDRQVWRSALVMLSKKHIIAAFWSYRAAFRAKSFISKLGKAIIGRRSNK